MLRAIKMQMIKLKHQYKIILAMIGLTLLMIFLFSGGQGGDYKENIGIVNQSDTKISKDFIKSLSESQQYEYVVTTEKEAIQKLEDSEMVAMIKIPETFKKDLLLKDEITISLTSIKSDVSIRLLENEIKEKINLMRSSESIFQLIDRSLEQKVELEIIRENYEKHWLYKKPLSINEESISSNQMNSNLNHSIIGFIILFVSYSIVYGIADVLEDVDLRTWHRMIVSPLSKNKLIFANSLVSFFTGFIQIILVFVISDYLFNSNFYQNIFQVSIVAALYVFALTGIAVFVISTVNSFKQMDALTPIVLTSMAMLGGCLWPLEIVNSKILLFLANLTPHKWAVSGLKKIMISQFSVEDIILELTVLGAIGFVFYFVGLYRINKKIYY
ncbi:MAG TPA: ABC transporter permease [Clostridia bacterium]|nr:ABC transporter permease [Clostridia bacterium]